MLNITEVKIVPIESHNRVVAMASILIDNCFIVKDIKVLKGENGIFIGMPSTRNKNSGNYYDIAHPINSETRKYIEDLIVKEYQETVG